MDNGIRVAVFDFDGTLTGRDSLLVFLRHAVGICRLLWGLLLVSPQVVWSRLRGKARSGAKQRLLQYTLGGRSREWFGHKCSTFAAASLLRPEMYAEVEKCRASGLIPVIVSASVGEWIYPAADALGIETVVATRLETDSQGFLTGRFDGPNCSGAEKVRRLIQHFGPDVRVEVCYGDSSNDRDIMAIAARQVWI